MQHMQSLLPPPITFALESSADVEVLGYRGNEVAQLDGILSIRHPKGRARVRVAALELRQSAPDRWQLHVLNFDRGECVGTSRGVYLTLSGQQAMEAAALGVPIRAKSTGAKSWKPGIVAVREGDSPEEVLGSVRGPHGIVKASWTRTWTDKDYETGEPVERSWTQHGYALVSLSTGRYIFHNKRRNACEAEADRLIGEAAPA